MSSGQSLKQGTTILVLAHSSRFPVNNHATAFVLVMGSQGPQMGTFSNFDPHSAKWHIIWSLEFLTKPRRKEEEREVVFVESLLFSKSSSRRLCYLL